MDHMRISGKPEIRNAKNRSLFKNSKYRALGM